MNQTTGNKTINSQNDNLPDARPANWYVTDWQTIEFAYQRWTDLYSDETWTLFRRPSFSILDICAGTGRWGRVFQYLCNNHTQAFLRNVELDRRFAPFLETQFARETFYEDILKEDLLEEDHEFDLIVGNPDFNVFHQGNFAQFMSNMHRLLSHKGWLILLASSSILFSSTRADMYRYLGLRLSHVEILSRRISFNPLFHPQAGQTGANDHVLLFFEKDYDKSSLASLSGGHNPSGRDTECNLIFRHEDTFLHQLPFGLWDFEFVLRDKKGKVIKKDGKTIPVNFIRSGELGIERFDNFYLVSLGKNGDHGIQLKRNKIPTIPEWIWNTIS